MTRFCSHCGQAAHEQSKFCASCGNKVEAFDRKDIQIVSGMKGYLKRRFFVYCIILVFLLIAGCVGAIFLRNEPAVNNAVASSSKIEKTTTAEKIPAKKAEDNLIAKSQRLLEQNKLQGEVIATSIGHSSQGFLSIIKSNGQYSFIIFDQGNNQVAQVPFSLEEYNLATHRNDKYIEPVIFNMTIFNDKHDRDEKDGVWNGENHMIPIYALYNFDSNGNIVPGMLTTGWGAKPSHYQGYLNEQKNVDIANLFLMEMKALQDNAKMNQVSIPMN